MKIKICGLFREEDIDYVNEACPDYAGFVFAESRRQVSPGKAESLRSRLAGGIIPVGVFVNAPIAEIAALYRGGIIELTQLHGSEDEYYIKELKDLCGITVIKTIKINSDRDLSILASLRELYANNLIDYIMFDSGAGSGKSFDWNFLEAEKIPLPWFLAGGVNNENLEQAMAKMPYAIDVSSGVETEGIKDREKILQLASQVKTGWKAK